MRAFSAPSSSFESSDAVAVEAEGVHGHVKDLVVEDDAADLGLLLRNLYQL